MTQEGITEELQRELVHRLRCLEGHVRGIAGMIERKESYDEILIQITAVKSALKQVTVRLIEGYLEGCIAGDPATGRDKEEIKHIKNLLTLVLKH